MAPVTEMKMLPPTLRTKLIIPVAHYLELHFHLNSKNIGVMPLNATPPPSAGKSIWDGACIVILAGNGEAKRLDAKRNQEQHSGSAEPIANSALQPR